MADRDKKRHPHADMAHEWLEDTSRVVEAWAEDGFWFPATLPMWSEAMRYRFADDPDRISPPTQVRTYQQRVEIPAALGYCPANGKVWAPLLNEPGAVWSPAEADTATKWLSLGIAYATREDALARRDAMLRTEGEEG